MFKYSKYSEFREMCTYTKVLKKVVSFSLIG